MLRYVSQRSTAAARWLSALPPAHRCHAISHASPLCAHVRLQKSVVLLSRAPCAAVLRQACALVAHAYASSGPAALDVAYSAACAWCVAMPA